MLDLSSRPPAPDLEVVRRALSAAMAADLAAWPDDDLVALIDAVSRLAAAGRADVQVAGQVFAGIGLATAQALANVALGLVQARSVPERH